MPPAYMLPYATHFDLLRRRGFALAPPRFRAASRKSSSRRSKSTRATTTRTRSRVARTLFRIGLSILVRVNGKASVLRSNKRVLGSPLDWLRGDKGVLEDPLYRHAHGFATLVEASRIVSPIAWLLDKARPNRIHVHVVQLLPRLLLREKVERVVTRLPKWVLSVGRSCVLPQPTAQKPLQL